MHAYTIKNNFIILTFEKFIMVLFFFFTVEPNFFWSRIYIFSLLLMVIEIGWKYENENTISKAFDYAFFSLRDGMVVQLIL